MKKEHSIHRGMLTRFLFAALIPVLIFAMVMQWNNRKTQMQTAENTIQRSLRNSDRGLDMMLDKYEAILDELRVEKEILDSVKEVKTGTDGAKASMEQLLRYNCQRNDGLEGILLVFPDKVCCRKKMPHGLSRSRFRRAGGKRLTVEWKIRSC